MANTTNTTHVFTGLNPDTNYRVTVKARDVAGNVSGGVSVEVITLPPPDIIAPTLTITPSTSVFTSSQEVTIITDETSTIYYTTDGTEPTVSSLIYTEPLTFFETTILKVFAIDSKGNKSSVLSKTYTLESTETISYLHMNGISAYLRTPVIENIARVEMVIETEWKGSPGYYIGARQYSTNPAYASMNGATTDYESGIDINYSLPVSPEIIRNAPIERNRKVYVSFDIAKPITYNPTFFARDNTTISDFLKADVYDIKIYNGDNTLVAHYDMNEGNVQDQSGNGNHATLVNGVFQTRFPYEDIITWVGGIE